MNTDILIIISFIILVILVLWGLYLSNELEKLDTRLDLYRIDSLQAEERCWNMVSGLRKQIYDLESEKEEDIEQ